MSGNDDVLSIYILLYANHCLVNAYFKLNSKYIKVHQYSLPRETIFTEINTRTSRTYTAIHYNIGWYISIL